MKKLLKQSPRDPFVTKQNGLYYRCFAEGPASISVSCADSVDGLCGADRTRVYTAEPGTAYSKELWAPELHVIDGECYIYVACDDGNNHNHRMYVLGNGSDDPLRPYKMLGKITDPTDKWAIDGTVMRRGGKLYFIWSGWEGDTNICQNLYIAEMSSPTAISSERVLISTPEHEWEKLGATGEPESPFINEGPFVFEANGRTILTYSASGSWCDGYCIAYLELTGDDPTAPDAWKKASAPILCKNKLVKGAGHCSVLRDSDGLHVFFHAWDADETNVRWDTVAAWHGKLNVTADRIEIE